MPAPARTLSRCATWILVQRLTRLRRKNIPSAKFYKDFRQMLDQMGDQIDAVTVTHLTPGSYARDCGIRRP